MAAAITCTVCVPLRIHLSPLSNACTLLGDLQPRLLCPELWDWLHRASSSLSRLENDAYLADWGCLAFLCKAGPTNQKVFFLKFLWIEAIITTIRAILKGGERGGMSFQLCSLEGEIIEDLFFCVSWSERKGCSHPSLPLFTGNWPTSMLFFNSQSYTPVNKN